MKKAAAIPLRTTIFAGRRSRRDSGGEGTEDVKTLPNPGMKAVAGRLRQGAGGLSAE